MDENEREPIDLFATLLVRCGYSPDEIPNLFRDAIQRIPAAVGRDGAAPFRVAYEAAQVITLWYMTPGYLDPDGNPTPLSTTGAAPSIEALVKFINPKAVLDEILECLLATRAIKKRGKRFVPRSRAMSYRHAPRYRHAHALHAVTGLVRTVEHNVRTARPPRWFEYTVDGWVPIRKRKQFDKKFRAAAHQMVRDVDALMLRLGEARPNGVDSVPLSVGVYFSETRPLDRLPSPARRTAQRHT